jgi:hypothetical protein
MYDISCFVSMKPQLNHSQPGAHIPLTLNVGAQMGREEGYSRLVFVSSEYFLCIRRTRSDEVICTDFQLFRK